MKGPPRSSSSQSRAASWTSHHRDKSVVPLVILVVGYIISVTIIVTVIMTVWIMSTNMLSLLAPLQYAIQIIQIIVSDILLYIIAIYF